MVLLLGAVGGCLSWQSLESLVPEGGRLRAAEARTRAVPESLRGAHGGCPNASISQASGFELLAP